MTFEQPRTINPLDMAETLKKEWDIYEAKKLATPRTKMMTVGEWAELKNSSKYIQAKEKTELKQEMKTMKERKKEEQEVLGRPRIRSHRLKVL